MPIKRHLPVPTMPVPTMPTMPTTTTPTLTIPPTLPTMITMDYLKKRSQR